MCLGKIYIALQVRQFVLWQDRCSEGTDKGWMHSCYVFNLYSITGRASSSFSIWVRLYADLHGLSHSHRLLAWRLRSVEGWKALTGHSGTVWCRFWREKSSPTVSWAWKTPWHVQISDFPAKLINEIELRSMSELLEKLTSACCHGDALSVYIIMLYKHTYIGQLGCADTNRHFTTSSSSLFNYGLPASTTLQSHLG